MPVHTYTNWNSRPSDLEEQIEPYRKYFFICEGANTETFYFKRLIDLRKQLGIHPLIDIRLWEKTDEDRNLSFAKKLADFAEKQKQNPDNDFDSERDKMVIVFDGDTVPHTQDSAAISSSSDSEPLSGYAVFYASSASTLFLRNTLANTHFNNSILMVKKIS